ncbi:MAG: hypothetical protein Q7S60_01485 [bacterium]|nr:hypothetical protein [bacterium]
MTAERRELRGSGEERLARQPGPNRYAVFSEPDGEWLGSFETDEEAREVQGSALLDGLEALTKFFPSNEVRQMSERYKEHLRSNPKDSKSSPSTAEAIAGIKP